MKNWKYIEGAEGIKIGNEKAISSTFHINDYGVEVGQWSWDWQGKAPDENKQKEIERKIKSYVQQINKNVPAGDSDERDAVFSQLDKFVRAQGLNKKTGNAESFDEFVKKLAKEKPELYQSLWNAGQMEALKSYYHKITGNDTPAEYFSKKPKVIGNEKTGAEGFFKQLSDDVKEREKKDDAEVAKVENAKEWDVKDSDVIEYINGDPNATKLQRICVEKLGTYDTSKVQALLVDEKSNKWAVVKRGTSAKMKVGNADEEKAKKEFIAVAKQKGMSDSDIKKMIEQIEKAGQNFRNQLNKVGNETYQHKLYPDKYVIIEGKNYKIVTDGKVEKSGELTDAVLYGINQTYKKVGNATPNYRYKDFLITNPEGHEYIVFLKDGRTVGYRGTTSKAQAEDWCDWHDPKTGKSIGNKVGNEASDDKFAYVMREFDEGKLKTPDGKVVTDPAQAKAIAYSESKKTENGLARARNAIKKS